MRPAVIPAADGAPQVARDGHESPHARYACDRAATPPCGNQDKPKRVARSSCEDTAFDGHRSRLARLVGDRSAVVVR